MPRAVQPPIDVVLARLVAEIPQPAALPGGSRYEPKWDGWRLIAAHDERGVRLWSRQGTDLTGRLPDVAAAVAAQVPTGVVLDGEVVVWHEDRLSFRHLQRRLTTSPRQIPALTRTHPASYVAFDLLEVAGQDIRPLAWRNRRRLLEELTRDWQPPLNVSPVTGDLEQATTWFTDLTLAGMEGLVVKGADQPYRGGQRLWVKVKSRQSLDVVCAAVIGPITAPQVVVAGLPVGERGLSIVGRSSVLAKPAARDLAVLLEPAEEGHPWPVSVPRSRVHGMGSGTGHVDLTLVQPLVVEVSADVAWSGSSFRHALRYLRARPDTDPGDVTVPWG